MVALIALALLALAGIITTIRTLPIDGYRRIPTARIRTQANRRVSR